MTTTTTTTSDKHNKNYLLSTINQPFFLYNVTQTVCESRDGGWQKAENWILKKSQGKFLQIY